MGCVWAACGLRVGCVWAACGLRVGCVWAACGVVCGVACGLRGIRRDWGHVMNIRAYAIWR